MNIRLKSLTVQDYRCFGSAQTVRLAPITLLVGENSSGKTSLLAMIRALWDSTFTPAAGAPDFKEPPFDLGSFDEILHRGSKAQRFAASFELENTTDDEKPTYEVETEFVPQWGPPILSRRRVSNGGCWIEQRAEEERYTVRYGTSNGSWERPLRKVESESESSSSGERDIMPPIAFDLILMRHIYQQADQSVLSLFTPLENSPPISSKDIEYIDRRLGDMFSFERILNIDSDRLFASAPVRSQPKRTYDLNGVSSDAEGGNTPMYLAQLSQRKPSIWKALRQRLEKFGKDAGLFNSLDLRSLGKAASSPFQINVGTFRKQKDEAYNLADVGYGVSQVLPLITKLLQDNGPQVLLFQQPEVHLHPSAQSALGNLLCEIVGEGKTEGRQIIVETHSDFIINRVRMAARDKVAGLLPEDISIIYFERGDRDVTMHDMRVDHTGNLLDVPSGYRKFFLKESEWFLGA